MTNVSSRWQGVAAVLASAGCFAASSILYKIAYRLGLTPSQVLALHSWIAGVILLVFVMVLRREVLRQKARLLGILVIIGLVGKLGTNILVAYALFFLPASVAIFLLYMYTVFTVAVGAVFLHKKVQKKEIIALALVTGGAILASGVLTGVRGTSLMGVFLALGSAVCYTIYNVVGEFALTKVSPLAVMSYTQWISALGIAAYFGKDVFNMPWTVPGVWGIGIAMAVISSILPFYLVLYGIRKIGAGQAAILSTFELPATFVIAWLFLQELPNWNQILGGLLVILGVVFLNFWKRQAQAKRCDPHEPN